MTGDTLIGIFKLSKASLLLLVAIGALSLIDTKTRDSTLQLVTHLSGDSHFRAIGSLAKMLGLATNRSIELVSVGALFYAALFTTEGLGLLLQRRWAEYFTSIVTASFLPLEIYEIAHKPEAFKILILGTNLAVLVYLILRIKH